MSTTTTRPGGSDVDHAGAPTDPIEAIEDEALNLETDVEERMGMNGPAAWWRLALVVVAVLVAALLAGQLLAGRPAPLLYSDGTPAGAAMP